MEMTKMEYASEIAKKIGAVTLFEAEAKEVTKNNNIIVTGVQIKNGSVGTIVYIDKDYEDGVSIDEAAQGALKAYNDNIGNGEYFSGIVDTLRDFETARGLIRPRLISGINDVSGIPHKGFLDMYIIYVAQIADSASVKVTDPMLESWGITLDELDAAARENIKPVALPMGEMLAELGFPLPEGEEVAPMVVITNEEKFFGASSILSSEITDKFDRDMYIIPSSVHEFIAVPADDDIGLMLGGMIREINATTVQPSEVLGNDPYLFNYATKEIRMVAA